MVFSFIVELIVLVKFLPWCGKQVVSHYHPRKDLQHRWGHVAVERVFENYEHVEVYLSLSHRAFSNHPWWTAIDHDPTPTLCLNTTQKVLEKRKGFQNTAVYVSKSGSKSSRLDGRFIVPPHLLKGQKVHKLKITSRTDILLISCHKFSTHIMQHIQYINETVDCDNSNH